MTATRIDPDLERTLRNAPEQQQDLIIRVREADDLTEAALVAAGLTVHRRLRLLPSFAVSGSGASALRLLDHPWVTAIEADRPVHTW